MAKPKTIEEIKIFKELLEKYKDEGTFGLGIIEGITNDKSDKISWRDVPKEMEKIFHY